MRQRSDIIAAVSDISSSRDGNGATAVVDAMPSSLPSSQWNTQRGNATVSDITTAPPSILRNTTAAYKTKEVVSRRRRVEWNLHQLEILTIPTRAMMSAESQESATIAASGVGVRVQVDANASRSRPTFDVEHTRPQKRNSQLSGYCVQTKKPRIADVDSTHTSTLLLPPPTLRNPPTWFHGMQSDPSPYQAVECTTGVLHISSSNSITSYHFWVTDSSLVPKATQYFSKKGFNNITFVAFGDRRRYMSCYFETAPLYPDALINNRLFQSMVLEPKAGRNFHPGFFSPKKKKAARGNGRRRKLVVTGPIFSLNGDDAASAGMVPSGEGGGKGRSLEEQGEVNDSSPPTATCGTEDLVHTSLSLSMTLDPPNGDSFYPGIFSDHKQIRREMNLSRGRMKVPEDGMAAMSIGMARGGGNETGTFANVSGNVTSACTSSSIEDVFVANVGGANNASLVSVIMFSISPPNLCLLLN